MVVDNDMPRTSLSPISTQCVPDKALKLHSLLQSLLKLDFDVDTKNMNGRI